MGKLFKHKRKPNKERKAFSKHDEKTVYTYGDGSERKQSYLNGDYRTVNSKGKQIRDY